MGIEQISASQVSSVNKELDAMVDEFRNRPLQEEYPILWIDALYEKIREHGHVVSMAVLVVKGRYSRWHCPDSRCGTDAQRI